MMNARSLEAGCTLEQSIASMNIALVALMERVEQIAVRIDHVAKADSAVSAPPSVTASTELRRSAPVLPDTGLVRRIIRSRQARAKHFDAQLFADPAWDMLLDLTASRTEEARVSVTSLCIASGVPATTALRWISLMVSRGIFVRIEDPCDGRRAFVELSEDSCKAISRYFADIAPPVLAI
jgi:hypothetical protein